MPANETLRDHLKRREGDLRQRLESLQTHIGPKKRELDEIGSVRRALVNASDRHMSAVARGTLAGSSLVGEDDDVTLDDFLDRREQELQQQTAGICGEIATLEKELSAIQRARRAIGMGAPAPDQTPDQAPNLPQRNSNSGMIAEVATTALAMASAYMAMSIKQLVIKALGSGHFVEGATPAEIRQFIKNAYGREIPSQSLSPQLSRLKADRQVRHDESADKWSITLAGAALVNENLPDELPTRREVLYDHPRSAAQREKKAVGIGGATPRGDAVGIEPRPKDKE